jgi:RNA polymerase sigma factor (sigma-70 family)
VSTQTQVAPVASERVGAATDVRTLVVRATDGDEVAWREIVRRFERLVWDSARHVRGLEHHDYEDVVATTWCRLVDAIGTLREPATIGGWLATTAYRQALQLERMRRRRMTLEVELRPEGPGTAIHPEIDREVMREQDRRAIMLAARGLGPSARRLLFALLDDPDASYREIEERHGIGVSSIGPTRGRAFRRLKANLTHLDVV